MAMSFEQLLERLASQGVQQGTLDEIARLSAGALDNELNPSTATAAQTKQYFDKVTAALEGYRKELGDAVNVDEELLNSYEEEMEVLRDIMDSEITATETNEERLNDAKERYKELVKLRKAKIQYNEGVAKGEQAAEQLLQATLGLSTEWNNLANKEGAKGLAKGFGKGLKSMLHPMNLLTSLAQKVVERALDYDKASADLFKKTGVDKNKLNLKRMATGLQGMKTDLNKSVVDSTISLQDGLRSIADLGVSQVESTVQTITILDSMGANSRDTVATFGILTKTLGKTPEQANEFLNNTVALADSISRPPSELLNDFVKAAPILARFGNQSEKVFKDISLQATLLEMDVAQLVGLSEGMDTFEGAAKAAQAFNIAVGQPFLSAQALLAAEPAQKLQLIADAYKNAGSVPLSARMRRGLAADMGVNPAELERILNLNSSELGTKRDEMDVVQSSMMDNIAGITKNQSAMDKITAQLQRIVDGLVQATNLDQGLGYVADLLTSVAVTLTKDHDLERSHAAKKKIHKEGGLVMVGDGRGYTKKQIADARASGDMSDPTLAKYLHSPSTGGNKSLMEMNDEQFKLFMEQQKQVMPSGEILAAKDARTLQSNAAKGLRTAGAATGAVMMTGLVLSFTGVGTPLGLALMAGAGASAGAYAYSSADEDALARGLGDNEGGFVVEPQEDAMATPMSVGNNYVQPVFNKQDKFYAAKDGGAIANALDEVLAAVDKLIEEKRDVNLDIKERELAQAVDGAFAAIQRRTV